MLNSFLVEIYVNDRFSHSSLMERVSSPTKFICYRTLWDSRQYLPGVTVVPAVVTATCVVPVGGCVATAVVVEEVVPGADVVAVDELITEFT